MRLALTIIAGALSALALVAPAQAATTKSVSCQVSGTATTASSTGFSGVHLNGGAGTYSFSSATGFATEPGQWQCVVTDGVNRTVVRASVVSSGNFTNSVTPGCGTGSASSTSVSAPSVTAETPDPANLAGSLQVALAGSSYGINFIATRGDFRWGFGSSIHGIPGTNGIDGALRIDPLFNHTDGGLATAGSALVNNAVSSGAANECTVNFGVTGNLTGEYTN